jgi:hypothetical protein
VNDSPPPELAELYAFEREPVVSDADRAAVLVRVAATLGVTSIVAGSGGSAGAAGVVGGGTAGLSGITGKIVALILVVGAGTGTAVYVTRERSHATAPVARTQASSATAPDVPSRPEPRVAVRAEAAGPLPPVASRTPDPPRRRPTSQPAEPHHVLIARAWALHARGDAAGVLELTERDARSHLTGELAEEREVLHIAALARLGRLSEARARAAKFALRFPTSIHSALIDRVMTKPPGNEQ